jgi:hypothetical protein
MHSAVPQHVLIFCFFLIISGSTGTVLWQEQHLYPTRAAGVSITSSPTLSATAVDHIFANVGSPMYGTGNLIATKARQTHIDDAFALAVWWVETNDGMAGVGHFDLNPGSVRGSFDYPTAYDGYTIYPSYAAAITDWFTLLQHHYVDQGLNSVYTISIPYVGTTGAINWANKVIALTLCYHYEAMTSATVQPSQSIQHSHTPHSREKPLHTRRHPQRIRQQRHPHLIIHHYNQHADTRHHNRDITEKQHVLPYIPIKSEVGRGRAIEEVIRVDRQQTTFISIILSGLCLIARRYARKRGTTTTPAFNSRTVPATPLCFAHATEIPLTPLLQRPCTIPLTPFITARAPGIAQH